MYKLEVVNIKSKELFKRGNGNFNYYLDYISGEKVILSVPKPDKKDCAETLFGGLGYFKEMDQRHNL